MSSRVRVAMIGVGQVADFHHVPGLRLDSRAELAALCDPDQNLLQRRQAEWNVAQATTDYEQIAADPNIDAAIVCTPNFTHAPITLALLEGGKHVMAEKPLGLSYHEAWTMYATARDRGLRHMTAFTYRFAPSMRYVKHLVATGALGMPRHFRSQRFLDLPETSWGWRQYQKLAGAGDLYDMTIHRIDFAEDLMGALTEVCGAVARFCPRDRTPDGRSCEPSDVDDWSGLIGRFESGAVGVWEGSTLMKGYHNDGVGYEWAEVNGSTGSAAYQLTDPNTIRLGLNGEPMHAEAVPEEFLVWPGSTRPPGEGKPSTVFRYDLVWEFISAIVEGRDALPGFDHGARAQQIADAVLESNQTGRWVATPRLE